MIKQRTTFKQTEIGMIPEDWEETTLGKVVTFQRGYDLPLKDIKSGKYPVIKSNGIAGYHNEFKSRGPGITIGRSGKLGEPFFIEEDYWPHNTTLYTKEFHNSHPKFVYYLLTKLKLVTYNAGSAVPTLNRNHIHPIPVIVPKKVIEQKAIAKTLSDLDFKIELNQQMNKTLEAIGQAIFKHWFVKFEFPNEQGKPYKSSGGEMVFNEELGKEIPKGWIVKKLSAISDNLDSKRIPLSSRERKRRKGTYPYYGATGILDYVDDFIFEGTHILMGEDGTVINDKGYPILQYISGKFWVNNHAHVLKGKIISNELLYMYLRNTNIKHIVTGAVQPKINQNNMNNLKFLIPDKKILPQMEKILNDLFEKIKANYRNNDDLIKIRNSLLPKLMSGKIRVPVNA